MQIPCPPAVMSDEFSWRNRRKGVEGQKKNKKRSTASNFNEALHAQRTSG